MTIQQYINRSFTRNFLDYGNICWKWLHLHSALGLCGCVDCRNGSSPIWCSSIWMQWPAYHVACLVWTGRSMSGFRVLICRSVLLLKARLAKATVLYDFPKFRGALKCWWWLCCAFSFAAAFPLGKSGSLSAAASSSYFFSQWEVKPGPQCAVSWALPIEVPFLSSRKLDLEAQVHRPSINTIACQLHTPG